MQHHSGKRNFIPNLRKRLRGNVKDRDVIVSRGRTPERGVLRDRVLDLEGWDSLKKNFLDLVQTALQASGSSSSGGAFFVNRSKSFGSGDTSEGHDRWVVDVASGSGIYPENTQTWETVCKNVNDLVVHLNTQSDLAGSEYICIRRSLMVDPPGSSRQLPHIDISDAQLFKELKKFHIWNVFLPVLLVEGHPETAFGTYERTEENLHVGLNDVVFFDGTRQHYGRGNSKSQPRILVNFVYVPLKMLLTGLGREHISQQYQEGGLDALPDKRNIFDSSTSVGCLVEAVFKRHNIVRSEWEKAGGLQEPS